MNKKFKNQSGIGLIEVIAAFGITLIVLTALVSMSVFTLRSSLQSKLLLQGSKLANEELEMARAMRDTTTWESFRTSMEACTVKCSIYSSGSAFTVSQNEEVFSLGTAEETHRYFKISNPNGALDGTENLLRVSVNVSWTLGGQAKNVYIYTDLSNWRGN